MSELTPLIARVRANPRDDATWLVIADRLTESDNPLGEYIVLSLQDELSAPPEPKKRRMQKLARAWHAEWAPWAKFVSWGRWGITLSFPSVEAVLERASGLQRIELPLMIEVPLNRYDAPDRCFFDADFTRMAAMNKSMTIENQNHSPGMDEDTYHWRSVKVWRVADGALLLERTFEAEWWSLEFRSDGLYGIDGNRTVLAAPL